MADFYTGKYGSFVLTFGKDANLFIFIDDNIKDHRLTAHLTIFGIGLFGKGAVDQDRDGLAAVGTGNGVFLKQVHDDVCREVMGHQLTGQDPAS